MDVAQVKSFLQSIAIEAVKAQEALDGGDSNTCLDLIEDIMGDALNAQRTLLTPTHRP